MLQIICFALFLCLRPKQASANSIVVGCSIRTENGVRVTGEGMDGWMEAHFEAVCRGLVR